ncbi:hypothetical protein KXD93_21900 [Mucilaginibacter sp. BJC16-A38]|uniref:hypothetical protein n=1 Tax=Mucilaginibacter phenanthrenivorans TaxID=1234842 RepID=UPI00215799EC|nr:hypothetical protein [Mucilaginibacter phenanthrenivorans]MCR8560322.1 hypothetical protein [Mucilaginibacter phenanthrenivorans]
MEKQLLKKRFDELLTEYDLSGQIERLYQKAVDSGAIDVDRESGDDYRLAKIIWYAIILKLREESVPYHPDNRKEAQNLSLFL